MTDPTAIRWESLLVIAGTFGLAVWALRDPEASKSAATAAGPLAARFRLRYADVNTIVDLDDRAILGRGHDCAVKFDEPTVSKHHARVGFDSRPWIEDLGSTNGTTVNGRVIAGSVWLRRGDRIALGAAKIVFLGLVPRGTSTPKG